MTTENVATTVHYLDEEGQVWTREELKADHAEMVAHGDLIDEMADFDIYLEEASSRNGTLQWISAATAQHLLDN